MLKKIIYLAPLAFLAPIYFLMEGSAEAEPQIAEAPEIIVDNCEGLQNINLSGVSMTGMPKNIANIYIRGKLDCSNLPENDGFFLPLGTQQQGERTVFSGTLSCHHSTPECSISNIAIRNNTWENPTGLFGELNSFDYYSEPGVYKTYYPQIKNIKFINASSNGARSASLGVIAGTAKNAFISNIQLENVHVSEIGNNGDMKGVYGGILGQSNNSHLCNVHADTITVMRYHSKYAGGLIGEVNNGSHIQNSSVKYLNSAEANVKKDPNDQAFGGLIGAVTGGNSPNILKISKSSVDHHGISNWYNSGGLVGYVRTDSQVQIDNSYSNLTLVRVQSDTSGQYHGGLVGRVDCSNGNINLRYNAVYMRGKIEDADHSRAMTGDSGYQSPCIDIEPLDLGYDSNSYYYDKHIPSKMGAGDLFSEKLSDGNLQSTGTQNPFYNWDKSEPNTWMLVANDFPKLESTEDYSLMKTTCEALIEEQICKDPDAAGCIATK
jgi:hypothetical protein